MKNETVIIGSLKDLIAKICTNIEAKLQNVKITFPAYNALEHVLEALGQLKH